MSCCCVVRLERQVPCWPRRAVLRALRPARRSAVRAVPNKGAGAGAARYSEEHALSVWKGPETSISESHPAPPLAEGRRRYPLTAVVGNAAAKTALLVAAVCPSLSVLLMGRHGTAKTGAGARVVSKSAQQLIDLGLIARSPYPHNQPARSAGARHAPAAAPPPRGARFLVQRRPRPPTADMKNVNLEIRKLTKFD